MNRQGPDIGNQYRSAIFYSSDEQKQIADAYIAQLAEARIFPHPIVTQVVPLKAFYPAEAYHQNYAARHPNDPYIAYNDAPKVAQLGNSFRIYTKQSRTQEEQMFRAESKRDQRSVNITRRSFIVTSVAAATGVILVSVGKSGMTHAASKESPQEVKIVRFSDTGERMEKVQVPKVVKTEEEWRKQLSRSAFAITRRADTEAAFTGKFWNMHESGLYRCICCENALFSSKTKFDSGTGWPSFWAPIAQRIFGLQET